MFVLPARAQSQASRGGELAFPGDPLESFGRTLDAILGVVAFGGKLADHLIGSARGRTRDVARSEIDGRSDGILVRQRPSPSQKRRFAPWSRCEADWKQGRSIACALADWPVTSGHGKCDLLST